MDSRDVDAGPISLHEAICGGRLPPSPLRHLLTAVDYIAKQPWPWPVPMSPVQVAVGQALLECAAAQDSAEDPLIVHVALGLGSVKLLHTALAAFPHLHSSLVAMADNRLADISRRLQELLRELEEPSEVGGKG